MSYKIDHILIPVNFTNASISGLKFGIQVAKNLNAKLSIFHVMNIPQPVGGLPLYIEDENDPSGFSAEINQKFKEIESEYLVGQGVKYEFRFKLGYLETRLSAFVENEKVDLIILGRKEPSGFMSFFRINVTRMLDRVGCPSIVIPESYSGGFPFNNACISCDFSKKNDKKILQASSSIIDILSRHQILLSVTENSTVKKIQEEREKVMNILSKNLPDLEYLEIPNRPGDLVSRLIINKVIDLGGDLIIVFPGKHFYSGPFSETFSKQMLKNKSIPVVIINSHIS
ncbi:universal stress protein [Marinigracilibium pacificum]|uniref:Universal stress protein n=1 Tax=Marinigracilibium pacificum TaxID=2729599 RepID=A0A848J158_9BACT|nr:universal stress protein [Marinigracilibium pacificum]NMM46972.1 universal stress protein [Marinigracilibium pacificum]